MTNEKCPDCEATVTVPEDALLGEILSCPDCGLDLEVTKVGQNQAVKALVVEKEDWGE